MANTPAKKRVEEDPLDLSTPLPQRPTTAAERPSTAKTRPGSATKRPGTAKKFSTQDLIKSATGLFSVFDRNKAHDEVRKLEEDVKGVEKVQAKLAKAEHKAAVATEKAEKAHRELMARAEAFLPKVQRITGALAAMTNFDDAKAALAEGRMLEKEAGLSSEALHKMDWPFHELDTLAAILEVEASLTTLLRARRHVDADDKDGSKLRKSVKMAIDTLEALVDEDEETRMEARGLNIPLDGEGGLLPKCLTAAGDLVDKLLEAAVLKEAALSNESRGKKAIKKDVMLAYDTLDKALDLAEEAAEKLQIDIQTEHYKDAQRKLQLLEQQHASILF